jgi:hypothetical protein
MAKTDPTLYGGFQESRDLRTLDAQCENAGLA